MNTGQSQPEGGGKRRAGPQGTQLLSVTEIQQLAQDETSVSDGRASTHEPVLEGVRGTQKGRRYLLRQGRRTIGRRDNNDIVIDDPSVSATHAWIINQHSHYVLMNTLSTNGTYVNDKRIHETVLVHGDRVRFGQAEFAFLTREQRSQDARHYVYATVALLCLTAMAGLMWWLL